MALAAKGRRVRFGVEIAWGAHRVLRNRRVPS